MTKLLVVDDKNDICQFAKTFFENRGLSVVTALSGEEALKVFSSEKPHLVLIDIKMDGMDGITLLKEIKKIDNNAQAIIVSAVEDKNVIKEAEKEGALTYVTKPLILEDLEKIVMERIKWIKTRKRT